MLKKIFIMLFITCLLNSYVPAAMQGGGMGGGGCGGGGCGGGGMGGGGSGTTIVNPPAGAAFKEPPVMPNISHTAGIVEVNLDANITSVNINGTTAKLMTYNGSYPGPTISAISGDIVKVHFKNSLPPTTAKNLLGQTKNITNIHTHGWHVSPKSPADNATLTILPGQTNDYIYDLQYHPPSTICLYHPHYHKLVAEQYWAGLMGIMMTADEIGVVAPYEMHIMILKDIKLSGTTPTPHSTMMDFMNGKESNLAMVNGQVNPVLNIRPGQIQRWRLVNASNAHFYKLQLEGHVLNLIGTDGGLLDKPYPQNEILLSPAERADVLITPKAGTALSGSYRLIAMPYSRGTMGMGSSEGSSSQITMLTLRYSGKALTPKQSLPAIVDPNAKRLVMDTSMLPHRTFTLSMMMGRGYINGQDFDVDPYTIMSDLNTYEVWEIVNQSMMDHPWHQHVNEAQVLSITGGDSNYSTMLLNTPAWKDVVIVPKMGSVKLLVPVMDYGGMTMFHCHILEHEDIGMMGMWDIMDMNEPPMP